MRLLSDFAFQRCEVTTRGVRLLGVRTEPDGYTPDAFDVSPWNQGVAVFSQSRRLGYDELLELRVPPAYMGLAARLGIPKETQRVLEGFGPLWLPTAMWCGFNARAHDLLSSNPLLLWMLLSTQLAEPDSLPADIDTLAATKQHELVEVLGGPPTKFAARLLRRLPPEPSVLGPNAFHRMHQLLVHIERLLPVTHCQRLTLTTAALLVEHPELLDVGFIRKDPAEFEHLIDYVHGFTAAGQAGAVQTHRRKIAQLAEEICQLVQDTFRNADLLERRDSARQGLQAVRSLTGLRHLHDRFVLAYNQDVARRNEELIAHWDEAMKCFTNTGRRLPDGPVADDDDVVQIKYTDDLDAEGVFMGHCVGAMKHRAQGGGYYVYRVLRPQRSTVSISTSDGRITVEDLRTFRNCVPAAECFSRVRAWLNKSSIEYRFLRDPYL